MKKYPLLSALYKWIIITIIVIVIFTLILLGLGYLLKENERDSRELKHRIDNNQASVNQVSSTLDPPQATYSGLKNDNFS